MINDMKHKRLPSGSYFGPRSRTPSKPNVLNGSIRKSRKPRVGFQSMRMKQIAEQVRKRRARMQCSNTMANDKLKSNYNVQYQHTTGNNKLHERNNNVQYRHMAANHELPKSNYNVKDQQGNHVIRKISQQVTTGVIVGQHTTDAMEEKFPQVSKMKEGLIRSHSNISKISNQANRLKAMPGLVLKSKEGLNVDQRLAISMHRSDLDGSNGITNEENSRSIKEPLAEAKPKSRDENNSKEENPAHRVTKKRRRYINTNEENDDKILESVVHANDCTRVTSHDDMMKDCHVKAPIPFVADYLKEQCHCSYKPIDEPVWSGLIKIGAKEYIPLAGHLSTKSCEKVQNLSKSLPRVFEVTKTPRSNVWPKRWEGSKPSNDNIGLYLFPIKMRPDKYHDQLLKEIMENDLSLHAIVGDAEMLMFPSNHLPKRYQTFQMKHYLWGVFKPGEVGGKKGVVLHHPDRTTAFVANDTCTVSLGATGVGTDASSIPVEDATVHEKHGQIDSSNMGAPLGKMVAFVVRQTTPRLGQLIREIQQEGSLIMQGEMMTLTPWLGNLAAVAQLEQLKN